MHFKYSTARRSTYPIITLLLFRSSRTSSKPVHSGTKIFYDAIANLVDGSQHAVDIASIQSLLGDVRVLNAKMQATFGGDYYKL